MANFDKSGMTQAGLNLLGKANAGVSIRFTKIVLGDGVMNGEIIDLKGVVSPKQNVDVTRINPSGTQCEVGGELLTSSVKQGFFWRECGLYAMDPQLGEILYNYAYSTKPDYIAASDSGMMEEILVAMIATVGSNTNVNVNIDDSMVFATKNVVDKKPYYYNCIADMKEDKSLKVGDMCVTLGYYEPNDGGAGDYRILKDTTLVVDSGSAHYICNGLMSQLIVKNNTANAKQFGARGDGVTDDTQCFTNFFNSSIKTLIVNDGIFYIEGDMKITSSKDVHGVNATLSVGSTIVCDGIFNVNFKNVNFIPHTSFVSLFNVTNSSDITFDTCFADGKGFDGDTPLETGLVYGFSISFSERINFVNCVVCNLRTGKGIEYDNCSECKVIGCYVHHTGRAGISVFKNNTDITVSGNILKSNVKNFTVNDGALDLYGSSNKNTILEKNTISDYGSSTNKGIGIRIKGSMSTICNENTIYCSKYSFSMIYVQNRDGVLDTNCNITNNCLYIEDGGQTTYGIRISEGEKIRVCNNCILCKGDYAKVESIIELRWDVSDCVVTGNTIRSLDGKLVNTRYGISTHNSGTKFENLVISDNIVDSDTRGVVIYFANKFVCTGNFIKTGLALSGAIHTDGCSYGIIRNNFIQQTSSPRVSDGSVASLQMIISDNHLITFE